MILWRMYTNVIFEDAQIQKKTSKRLDKPSI